MNDMMELINQNSIFDYTFIFL